MECTRGKNGAVPMEIGAGAGECPPAAPWGPGDRASLGLPPVGPAGNCPPSVIRDRSIHLSVVLSPLIALLSSLCSHPAFSESS